MAGTRESKTPHYCIFYEKDQLALSAVLSKGRIYEMVTYDSPSMSCPPLAPDTTFDIRVPCYSPLPRHPVRQGRAQLCSLEHCLRRGTARVNLPAAAAACSASDRGAQSTEDPGSGARALDAGKEVCRRGVEEAYRAHNTKHAEKRKKRRGALIRPGSPGWVCVCVGGRWGDCCHLPEATPHSCRHNRLCGALVLSVRSSDSQCTEGPGVRRHAWAVGLQMP
ncbi:hypothetical protein NDU88_003877 [Pleurodeles waltl]|uniref:Uncharacterized protein n=1 Tax=Pleurodeles waltl TaxID=8319 RepID=A0AAV7M7K5_PLEWA|nr:hypothetical protein NDU88_003877 [Pleurodeles waltl]